MKKVFFTVDVECHDIDDENLYIWGKNGEEESGLRKILEMGKKLNMPINFFVDMPESLRYGNEYLDRIINLINEYNQPIFLHLHPNYISGDDERSFLWQYSKEEQLDILQKGYEIYVEFMHKEPKAFRIGRYGMDTNAYECLKKVMPDVIDFSYLHENGKMCHVDRNMFGASNIPRVFKGIKCVPNSTFLGLNLFGIRKRITVDASQMRFGELKRFMHCAENYDFTMTMHSWHFIDKVFWDRNRASVNKIYEKRFEKYVNYIRRQGYEIASIEEMKYEEFKHDFDYDSGGTVVGKIGSIIYNFFRFQEIAKINKKYKILYSSFYLICILICFLIIMFFIK